VPGGPLDGHGMSQIPGRAHPPLGWWGPVCLQRLSGEVTYKRLPDHMAYKVNHYDNAAADNFIKHLKSEEI